MRILFAHHFHASDDKDAAAPAELVPALASLGHEVRLLVVDRTSNAARGLATRTIVQPTAPRNFADFRALSDAELAAYRELLRQALDEEIAAFNPHVIHCPAVWLFGHLALESGVPYTLAAAEAELLAAFADGRLRDLAQQAAENAGRVFVRDEATARRVVESLGAEAERVVLVPATTSTTDYAARLAAEFSAMLVERFGTATA